MLILFISIVGMSSCEVDNMDAPDCHIHGVMTYHGMPIGIRATGTGNLSNSSVSLELWQSGFGKETAQNVNVAQDGSFSTYIYSGEFRLVTKPGVGPWEKADTVRFTAKGGEMEINYEVVPYFTISDVNYQYNATDSTLNATFNITKIVEDANIKSVGLLVNNTLFVDLSYNKSSITNTGNPGEVILTLNCKSLVDCKSLFARVFVRSDKSNEAVYSLEPYQVW